MFVQCSCTCPASHLIMTLRPHHNHPPHTCSLACARDKSKKRVLCIFTGHCGMKSSARGAAPAPVGAIAEAISRAAQRARHPLYGQTPRTVLELKLNEHRTTCTCAHCGAANAAPRVVPHKLDEQGVPTAGKARNSIRWRMCPCHVWEHLKAVPQQAPAHDAPPWHAWANLSEDTLRGTVKATRVHRDNNAVHNMLRQAVQWLSTEDAKARLPHLAFGQAGRDGSHAALQ